MDAEPVRAKEMGWRVLLPGQKSPEGRTNRSLLTTVVTEAHDHRDDTVLVQPEEGEIGTFRQADERRYWIGRMPRSDYGQKALRLYGDPEITGNLEYAMCHIVRAIIEQQHCTYIVLWMTDEWGINLDDQANFVAIMGAMIRRVVDAVNVNEAARGTEGEFTFEVVCGTVEMSRVFEEHYFDTAEGTEGEHVWYADGQSPGTSPAVSTGSPKRCESCGLSGKGQLTSMTTPPRECLGRTPRVLELCDECLIKEKKQNEQDVLREREFEQDNYLNARQQKAMYETEMTAMAHQQMKEQSQRMYEHESSSRSPASFNNPGRVPSGDNNSRRVSFTDEQEIQGRTFQSQNSRTPTSRAPPTRPRRGDESGNPRGEPDGSVKEESPGWQTPHHQNSRVPTRRGIPTFAVEEAEDSEEDVQPGRRTRESGGRPELW